MSVNDVTGDRLVSAVQTDKYREGYDAIFGKPKQPPSYESELCAQGTLAHNDAQYLARSRAVIAEFWDDMPEMWRKLDELSSEYQKV